MRPCAFTGHALLGDEGHLCQTEKYAIKCVADDAGTIARRFSMAGVPLDASDVKSLVRLTCICHDVGKASDEYQRQFNDKCELIAKSLPSFKFHEIPSAVVAWRICQELSVDRTQSVICFVTVLQHLHASRDWLSASEQRRIICEDMRFKSGWNFRKFGDATRQFLKDKLGVEVELDVRLDEGIRIVDQMINWLRRIRESSWPRLYCLILAPLMVGDNLDATKSRGNNVSASRAAFIDELQALMT